MLINQNFVRIQNEKKDVDINNSSQFNSWNFSCCPISWKWEEAQNVLNEARTKT
jgi:hypothetical protein